MSGHVVLRFFSIGQKVGRFEIQMKNELKGIWPEINFKLVRGGGGEGKLKSGSKDCLPPPVIEEGK